MNKIIFLFFVFIFNDLCADVKYLKKLEGDFILSDGRSMPEVENDRRKFMLYEFSKDQKKDYVFRIYPFNNNIFCEYLVTKLTAPQYLSKRQGVIAIKPKQCNVSTNNPKIVSFWQNVQHIGITYEIIEPLDNLHLKGTIHFFDLNKSIKLTNLRAF